MGAVLAGGAATRLGGSKAALELAGQPLIAYPLTALSEARIEAIVVAKPDSDLPPVDVQVVAEPPEPRHPLLGVVTALEHADGTAVVTCPCDTPFVTAALLTALAATDQTAAVHDGERLHPLLARYRPGDLPALRVALEHGRSATSAVEGLNPTLIRTDAATAFNINTPDDLAAARARLG